MNRYKKFKSRPTTWNGIRYRSRLEARWAIAFHLLRAEVFYEPPSLRTRGCYYHPDFLILTEKGAVVLEVKPVNPTSEERVKLIEWSNKTPSVRHLTPEGELCPRKLYHSGFLIGVPTQATTSPVHGPSWDLARLIRHVRQDRSLSPESIFNLAAYYKF